MSKSDKSPILTVAVSSRALFDFEEENEIFKLEGEEAYICEQKERLENKEMPKCGVAFALVKKLLSFNSDGEELVHVSVISRNDPVTGLRVLSAIKENKLDIKQGYFTRGAPSFPYLKPLGAHLFLSALEEDVKKALESGVPAAHVIGCEGRNNIDNVLRIAFDGDAVLFDDASEQVFQKGGLDIFRQEEQRLKDEPMSPGPFFSFLEALAKLRKHIGDDDGKKIRIALITARGPETYVRPIKTFQSWNINVDEAFFMSGESKREVVETFGADIFFDDQVKHVTGIKAAGHVPSGVINEKKKQ